MIVRSVRFGHEKCRFVRLGLSQYLIFRVCRLGGPVSVQWWALSLIKAKPLGGDGLTGKKGSDKGIDGTINFMDDGSKKLKRVIVQVKSGKVRSGDIRDLKGTLGREKAQMAVFLTLEPPTKDMVTEAVSEGFYESPGWGRKYPKVQILTVEALLKGASVLMPPAWGTFKQAERVEDSGAVQGGFDLEG